MIPDFRNPRKIFKNPDQIFKIENEGSNPQKSELSTPSELGERAICVPIFFLVQKKIGYR